MGRLFPFLLAACVAASAGGAQLPRETDPDLTARIGKEPNGDCPRFPRPRFPPYLHGYFSPTLANEIRQNGILTVGADVLVGPQSYFNETLVLLRLRRDMDIAPNLGFQNKSPCPYL